jgi:hypothetical protein
MVVQKNWFVKLPAHTHAVVDRLRPDGSPSGKPYEIRSSLSSPPPVQPSRANLVPSRITAPVVPCGFTRSTSRRPRPGLVIQGPPNAKQRTHRRHRSPPMRCLTRKPRDLLDVRRVHSHKFLEQERSDRVHFFRPNRPASDPARGGRNCGRRDRLAGRSVRGKASPLTACHERICHQRYRLIAPTLDGSRTHLHAGRNLLCARGPRKQVDQRAGLFLPPRPPRPPLRCLSARRPVPHSATDPARPNVRGIPIHHGEPEAARVSAEFGVERCLTILQQSSQHGRCDTSLLPLGKSIQVRKRLAGSRPGAARQHPSFMKRANRAQDRQSRFLQSDAL